MLTAYVKYRLIFVKAVVLFDSQTEAGMIGCAVSLRLNAPNTDTLLVSFSAVYCTLTLEIAYCVYQNTCQNGYFNITLCMYPSVDCRAVATGPYRSSTIRCTPMMLRYDAFLSALWARLIFSKFSYLFHIINITNRCPGISIRLLV